MDVVDDYKDKGLNKYYLWLHRLADTSYLIDSFTSAITTFELLLNPGLRHLYTPSRPSFRNLARGGGGAKVESRRFWGDINLHPLYINHISQRERDWG